MAPGDEPSDRDLIVLRRATRTVQRPDLGWVLTILALLVLPVASWHDVTTLHEVCPEHGETLDVAVLPGAAEQPSDEGPRWSAGEAGHGTHDVCPFVQLGQPSSPAPEVELARALPRPARVEAALAHCERHAPIPVLLLAPKQSPPV